MNHLTLAASRRERFFGDDSPYETLLHAWYAIQSREGKRQLRHCASTCLFATCLVCSQLMPLPFERDIYCGTACVWRTKRARQWRWRARVRKVRKNNRERQGTAICMCTVPIPCFTKRNISVNSRRNFHVEKFAKISRNKLNARIFYYWASNDRAN